MSIRAAARILPGLLISALTIALYADTFRDLFKTWMSDGNYAHGMMVIPVSLALVYAKRNTLAKIPVRPSALGNILLAAGLVVFAFSRWSDVTFLAGISIVFVVGGLVWILAGPKMLRELAFPILFLTFMTPPPDYFVEKIGAPLQRASCKYAAMLGGLLGMDVYSEGVMLMANGLNFEVDLPCSGIRAINALTAFAAVLAYLAKTSNAKRISIFLAAVPIAFVSNVFRVFVVIVAANMDLVKKDVMRCHDISGPVVFLLALGIVLFIKKRAEISRDSSSRCEPYRVFIKALSGPVAALRAARGLRKGRASATGENAASIGTQR